MSFICFNGKMFAAETPVLSVSNRSYKWGDGVFETIRVKDGKIPLETYHFERLFSSLKLLQINAYQLNQEKLLTEILQLCDANKCAGSARVRLAVSRDDESGSSYSIEAKPIAAEELKWTGKGMTVDVFPFARKPMDALANIKSSSFLIYILAGNYARENMMDDAIVLNTSGRICDTSRANLFLIRNSEVFTPALSEGCVNGVMRRMVIEKLKDSDYRIHQGEITSDELLNADEVFLTNAIAGIRWVESFRDKKFSSGNISSIFKGIQATFGS
jgi:branched-chain amino acid aminotransferase